MLQKSIRLLWPLLLLAGTLGVLALAIGAFGQRGNPGEALQTLWRGAFGSLNAFSATLARATILIFYALGVVLSFRAGIFNIGAEGQSRVGAIAAAGLTATAAGTWLGGFGLWSAPLILLCGALCGAAWSLLAGALRIWRGAPEVISTLMLNFIALQLALFLLSRPTLLQEAKAVIFQSDTIPDSLQLQTWGDTQFHSGVLLIVPALLLSQLYLFNMRGGMELRAVGLNPTGAKACGIPVNRVILRAFACSGGLAGFAGALGVLVRSRLDKTPYPGNDYGFMAIAVALVADLRPLWVLPAAVLFAGLDVGTGSMERNAGVSREVVYLVEGLIILAVLIRRVVADNSAKSATPTTLAPQPAVAGGAPGVEGAEGQKGQARYD